MSHVARVQVEFQDADCLKAAVEAEGGTYTHEPQTVRFMDGTRVTGSVIKLPSWNNPIVLKDGEAVFDNYNGYWGKMEAFDAVKQRYTSNVTKKQLQGQHGVVSFTEERLADGSIRMVGTTRGGL